MSAALIDTSLNTSLICYTASSTTGIELYSDRQLFCPQGFHCPNTNSSNTNSTPVVCPPSATCGLQRLLAKQCATSQGRYEPEVCQAGFYCPTPADMFICPVGYYCPTGTVKPYPCDSISSCPEGSITQASYISLVICIIFDAALFLLFLFIRINELERSGLPMTNIFPPWFRNLVGFDSTKKVRHSSESVQVKYDNKTTGEKNSGSNLPVTTSSSSTNSAEILVDAFRKALGGRTLHMDFKFNDLGLKLDTGKVVLQGVTGEIRSSRMTAIMGPSGAGKTTFMNVLCGKVNRTSGKLWISGKESEISDFKKIIGYVPQEDIMHRELTVREIILHSARVRLPKSWSSKEVEMFTDNVIRALNLSHVAHSPIGDETTRGVSGGQRKRVNVGMELAAVPICLFLDEPTSGLDSTAALEVANILEQITELGMTIVAVIHQPRVEIFRKFDDVLMIAPGGRTAYLGPTSSAQTYFEKLGYIFDAGANAADVLMDILSGKGDNPKNKYKPEDLVQLWIDRDQRDNGISYANDRFNKKIVNLNDSANGHVAVAVTPEESNEFHQVVRTIVAERGASVLNQIWFCHNRSLLQQMRKISTLVLEVFVGMLAGLLMGVAVQGTPEMFIGLLKPPMTPLSTAPMHWLIPQYGLLIGMAVALAGAPAGVKVFAEEKPVYWRETSSGQSTIGYYLGKTLATTYRILLSSLHFATMLHVIAKPIMSFNNQYTMIMLTFYGVYGMSCFVSMIVARENASLLAVVVCLFAAVFCGYGPSIRQAYKWKVGFIWDASYNRWAAEAQFSDSVTVYSDVYFIRLAIDSFGYTVSRVGFDFGMMVVIGAVWRIAAYILLIYTNRDKQR